MGKRKKIEKTPEQIDLENVQRLMEEIRMTCMGFADCGGQLQGKSWTNDCDKLKAVSAIYEEAVHSLRAVYRRVSEAEEILEAEAAATMPAPRPKGFLRLLGGGGRA